MFYMTRWRSSALGWRGWQQTSRSLGQGASESAEETCEACTGTVELYHQHILIFTGDRPWPSVLENPVDGIPFVRKMVEAVKRREREGLNGDVKFRVGAIQGHFSEAQDARPEGVHEVVLFPSALRFAVREEEVEELLESFLSFSTPFQVLHRPVLHHCHCGRRAFSISSCCISSLIDRVHATCTKAEMLHP
jgi:hypothetical protein